MVKHSLSPCFLGRVDSEAELLDVPGRIEVTVQLSQHELRTYMNPIYNFKGQAALVTGAAKGMGLATARMFAGSGACVVLADIDGHLAAKEAERIVLEGGTAIGIACDVADEAQVAAMVDRAVAEYGRLDMAFNNAGIQVPPSDAADEPIEHFERVTAVNQRSDGPDWFCLLTLLVVPALYALWFRVRIDDPSNLGD